MQNVSCMYMSGCLCNFSCIFLFSSFCTIFRVLWKTFVSLHLELCQDSEVFDCCLSFGSWNLSWIFGFFKNFFVCLPNLKTFFFFKSTNLFFATYFWKFEEKSGSDGRFVAKKPHQLINLDVILQFHSIKMKDITSSQTLANKWK